MATSQDSLHVIGLISGGKDSFFSLLHCVANNHRIVALANLYNGADANGSGDLNSFMYQTAGQGIVPLYSDVTGLPLYRQKIQGFALDQSMDYHTPLNKISSKEPRCGDGDETESLIPLLHQVLKAHPTANAICSGAILSNYQRTRIESVASRLGLVSLTYLWQYPSLPPSSPEGLLNDMAAAGFDVRIVKVASGGLGEELLWCNLMDNIVRKKVHKAVGKFGGSMLGEGGEYETLVIDGPVPLWRGRIEADPKENWIGRGGGGEAWMGFPDMSARVVLKEGQEAIEAGWRENVKRPKLWDAEFRKLIELIPSEQSSDVDKAGIHISFVDKRPWRATKVIVNNPHTTSIHNLTAPQEGYTASDQMLAINLQLLDFLKGKSALKMGNVVFTTILLRSMADFESVNAVYAQLFVRPNPPARVTIACGDHLPLEVLVMASFVIDLEKEHREGLHVQSRSYWAPANIGPYSQAISVPLQPHGPDPRFIYVSGQIPLIPATMRTLCAGAEITDQRNEPETELFTKRVSLGLQHLWRIGHAMNVSSWTGAIAFIVGSDDVQAKALTAWKAWREIHQPWLWKAKGQKNHEDGIDDYDVWDQRYGGMGSFVKDEGRSYCLPDFERSSNQVVPQFFAVQVDGLPRGCEVEWYSSGIAYSHYATPSVHSPSQYVPIDFDSRNPSRSLRTETMEILENSDHLESPDATVYTSRPDLVGDLGVQVIPCKAVWGPAGRILAAGIVLRSSDFVGI